MQLFWCCPQLNNMQIWPQNPDNSFKKSSACYKQLKLISTCCHECSSWILFESSGVTVAFFHSVGWSSLYRIVSLYIERSPWSRNFGGEGKIICRTFVPRRTFVPLLLLLLHSYKERSLDLFHKASTCQGTCDLLYILQLYFLGAVQHTHAPPLLVFSFSSSSCEWGQFARFFHKQATLEITWAACTCHASWVNWSCSRGAKSWVSELPTGKDCRLRWQVRLEGLVLSDGYWRCSKRKWVKQSGWRDDRSSQKDYLC